MKTATKKNMMIAVLAAMAFVAVMNTARTARADNPVTPSKTGTRKG